MKKAYFMLGRRGIYPTFSQCCVLQRSKVTGASQERPNILFIMSDDHAVQALSAYGHPISKLAPTPNIDRIAAKMVCTVPALICDQLPVRSEPRSDAYR